MPIYIFYIKLNSYFAIDPIIKPQESSAPSSDTLRIVIEKKQHGRRKHTRTWQSCSGAVQRVHWEKLMSWVLHLQNKRKKKKKCQNENLLGRWWLYGRYKKYNTLRRSQMNEWHTWSYSTFHFIARYKSNTNKIIETMQVGLA